MTSNGLTGFSAAHSSKAFSTVPVNTSSCWAPLMAYLRSNTKKGTPWTPSWRASWTSCWTSLVYTSDSSFAGCTGIETNLCSNGDQHIEVINVLAVYEVSLEEFLRHFLLLAVGFREVGKAVRVDGVGRDGFVRIHFKSGGLCHCLDLAVHLAGLLEAHALGVGEVFNVGTQWVGF